MSVKEIERGYLMLPSRSQSALAVGPEVAPPVTAAAPSRATTDTDSEQSNACIHHPQDSPGKPVSEAPGSADLTSTSAGAAPTSTRWNGYPTTAADLGPDWLLAVQGWPTGEELAAASQHAEAWDEP